MWPPPVRATGSNDFFGVNTNGWKIANSSEFAGVDWGPIMDTRWNGITSIHKKTQNLKNILADLPALNVSNSSQQEIPVKSKNGVLHEYFSIAARQPIMISLRAKLHTYNLYVGSDATTCKVNIDVKFVITKLFRRKFAQHCF
jgi:hypothetical protein